MRRLTLLALLLLAPGCFISLGTPFLGRERRGKGKSKTFHQSQEPADRIRIGAEALERQRIRGQK